MKKKQILLRKIAKLTTAFMSAALLTCGAMGDGNVAFANQSVSNENQLSQKMIIDAETPVSANDSVEINMIDIPIVVKYGQTEARKALNMINSFRTGSDAWYWSADNSEKIKCKDLGKLKYDYNLEKVAMKRAAEIALSYSHTRPNGSLCFTAFTEEGAIARPAGENIAAGYDSIDAVHAGWREDSQSYSGQGHRRNMLNSNYTAIGVGHVYYNGIHYWVEEFGVDSGSESVAAKDGNVTVNVQVKKKNIVSWSFKNNDKYPSYRCGDIITIPKYTSYIKLVDYWNFVVDDAPTKLATNSDVVEGVATKLSDGSIRITGAGNVKLKVSNKYTSDFVNIIAGHKEVISKAVEATCTKDGHTEGSYCSSCKKVLKEQKVIPKKAHTLNVRYNANKKKATCKKAGGYDTEYYCTTCGKVVDRIHYTIPKLAHRFNKKYTKANVNIKYFSGTASSKGEKATSGKNICKNGKIEDLCKACGTKKKAVTTVYSPKKVVLSKNSFVYNGKACKPSVKVIDSKGKSVPSKYYSVSYKNNVKVGTATVNIKFKGNLYSGQISVNYKIVKK